MSNNEFIMLAEAARDTSRAYHLGLDISRAMSALADALATWDGRGMNGSTKEGQRGKEQAGRRVTSARGGR